jgi:protein-tyrosine kinase
MKISLLQTALLGSRRKKATTEYPPIDPVAADAMRVESVLSDSPFQDTDTSQVQGDAALGNHDEDVRRGLWLAPSEPPAPGSESPGPAPAAGTIGAILVASGRLSAEDAQRVMELQLESGAPFGEAARQLGLASAADIHFALAQQYSLHCLAAGDDSVDPKVVAAFEPGHEIAETMRLLRGQILQGAPARDATRRTIAIVGAEPGTGCSFVAANLATVFAQLGQKTLLVDGNVSKPHLHELFRISNRVGLSSILAERAKLDAIQPCSWLPTLAILPAGPIPPNPNDLYARRIFPLLLRECEKSFPVVILDVPPWNDGSAAAAAAAAAGYAVVVARADDTRAADAHALAKGIAGAGAVLVGAVLNRS